jgi:3-dehydroquinate dehydratase-1
MDLLRKIIVSIPFRSKKQFENDMQSLIALDYPIQMIEVRWDYFSEFITVDIASWVIALIHSFEKKVIFTYENKKKSSEKGHILIIKNLIANKPDYIDLDVNFIASLLTDLVELAISNDISIIYSYHNWEETPPIQIINDMFEFFIQMLPKISYRTNNILKMIFTAKDSRDVKTVLQFGRQNCAQGIPLITFCMGELGKASRIESILIGCAYTYAYIGEPTAPGQLHISEIHKHLHDNPIS